MESTVRLTAEIADGWLPPGLVPETYETYRPWIDEGLAKAEDRSQFGAQGGGAVIVTDERSPCSIG